jgi:hypothetical protein
MTQTVEPVSLPVHVHVCDSCKKMTDPNGVHLHVSAHGPGKQGTKHTACGPLCMKDSLDEVGHKYGTYKGE